jgi:O-antigen/teichoic acid export membrane protein
VNIEPLSRLRSVNFFNQATLPRRVAINSLWLILGRAGSQVFSIIFTILVARYLGEAGLGQYAFLTSIIFIGNVISTFGMDTLLIREVAGRLSVDSFSLGPALWVQLILSAILISLIFLLGGRLPGQASPTTLALRIFSFSLIPFAFFTVFSAVLRAYERMDLYLVANLATSALQTAGIFILLHIQPQLIGVAWAFLLAQICGAAVAAGLCYQFLPQTRISFNSSVNKLAKAFRLGFSLALLAILAVIYQRIVIIVLSTLASDRTVGLYSAAGRVVEASRFVHYAILGALFPVLSTQASWRTTRLRADNSERSSQLSYAVFSILIFFSLGFALSFQRFAGPIIGVLFGSNYFSSVQVLKILVWSLVPYTISAMLSLDLVTRGLENKVLTVSAIVLVFSIPFYAFMIHYNGMEGAGFASVFVEALQALLLFLSSRKGNKIDLEANLSLSTVRKDIYGITELSH